MKKREYHGMTGKKIYQVWRSMLTRCYTQSDTNYKFYGARGIKVCSRWKNFSKFYEDMGEPSGRQLDRIDNSKGYYKQNCRWVSSKQNCRNRRSNVYLEFDGAKKTIAEWTEVSGIKRTTIIQRLRRGWSVERTLTAMVP